MVSNIPSYFQINDNRKFNDFNHKTFSNYAKRDVYLAFKKALMDGLIETACNWATELLVTGLIEKIYEVFIYIVTKHIHINNPKLPYRLYRRYNFYLGLFKYIHDVVFKNDKTKVKEVYLLLRNFQPIRNHISELCVIIARSPKTVKGLVLTSIKDNEYSSEYIKRQLKAGNLNYIDSIKKYGDTNEAIILMNDFYYAILNSNYKHAVYTLSWILGYEKLLIKKEKEYSCGRRNVSNIEDHFKEDFIWIPWAIISKEMDKLDTDMKVQIQALFKMFKFEYHPSKKSKRISLLLHCIKYITDFYSINTPIINNYKLLIQATCNINNLFHNLKGYEITDSFKYSKAAAAVKSKNKLKKKSVVKISKLDEIDTQIINSSIRKNNQKFNSIINNI